MTTQVRQTRVVTTEEEVYVPLKLTIAQVGEMEVYDIPDRGMALQDLQQYRPGLKYVVNGAEAAPNTLVKPGDVVFASTKHANG